MRTPIFLYGAGGHARSVWEVIERQGLYEVVVVLDDAARGDFRGVPVLPGRQSLQAGDLGDSQGGFVAIGDNDVRRELSQLADAAELQLVTLVDPAATVARDVAVGDGSVVMPGVVVNVGSTIGRNAILNTSCSVDHDCTVDDYAHLSPGVHVSGECEIGSGAHLGIGVSVMQRIRIGENAVIGAGAAVLQDVGAGATAVGVPARSSSADNA